MNAEEIFSQLKNSPELLFTLKQKGKVIQAKAGDIIMDSDVEIDAVPIVLSGMLRILRSDEEGRDILLYYLSEGESCILSLLGGDQPQELNIRAEAETDSEILLLPIDQLGLMMRESPEWLDYIFKLYHKRFEELLQVVESVAFKKMDERLLDLLKKKAVMKQTDILHITHEQLAGELGTARVVVSRLLKQMEKEGMAVLGRNSIRLMQL